MQNLRYGICDILGKPSSAYLVLSSVGRALQTTTTYRTINGAFRRLPWISQRHHGVQTMGQVWMDDWLAGDRRRVEILLQPLNYGWDGEMGSQMPNNHFHSSSCCARPWAVSYTLFCKRPGWWWWLASHVLNRAIYGTGWRYDREFVRCHYHEITWSYYYLVAPLAICQPTTDMQEICSGQVGRIPCLFACPSLGLVAINHRSSLGGCCCCCASKSIPLNRS